MNMQHSRPCILVVDDDPDHTALVASILDRHGYRTLAANRAEEARRLTREHGPEAAVLDVMMGYLTEGFDLARSLRREHPAGSFPILFLTGMDTVFDLSKEIGEDWIPGDSVIHKPVRSGELLQALEQVLGRLPRAEESDLELAPPSGRVLIVEDEPDFAAYLAQVLASDGFETNVAHSLEEARNALAGSHFDLLTLDIELGDGSGGDLLVELRQHPRLRTLPIVVVSGLPQDHPKMVSLLAAFGRRADLTLPDAFLEKPVESGRLRSTVASVLGHRIPSG